MVIERQPNKNSLVRVNMHNSPMVTMVFGIEAHFEYGFGLPGCHGPEIFGRRIDVLGDLSANFFTIRPV